VEKVQSTLRLATSRSRRRSTWLCSDAPETRISLRLVDVPWDQALDIVLQGLECVKIGNVWGVSSITRLKEEREAKLAREEAAEELEPLKTAEIHVNYRPVARVRGPRGLHVRS
jgi:type IV pilus assembly protein PilQ